MDHGQLNSSICRFWEPQRTPRAPLWIVTMISCAVRVTSVLSRDYSHPMNLGILVAMIIVVTMVTMPLFFFLFVAIEFKFEPWQIMSR